jgi:hypothetical protein
LTNDQLVELGVRWIAGGDNGSSPRLRPGMPPLTNPIIFVTRLHVRYDAASFPEDLFFMQTGDRGEFSSEYIVQQPWDGTASCPEADRYRARLQERFREEANNLVTLTGWSRQDIETRMQKAGSGAN